MQLQWIAGGPSPERRPRKPAPPDLILESDNPLPVPLREADVPIPPCLLLRVVGVRTGHPQLGATPLDPQSLKRPPDRFITDLPICDSKFRTGLGEELK